MYFLNMFAWDNSDHCIPSIVSLYLCQALAAFQTLCYNNSDVDMLIILCSYDWTEKFFSGYKLIYIQASNQHFMLMSDFLIALANTQLQQITFMNFFIDQYKADKQTSVLNFTSKIKTVLHTKRRQLMGRQKLAIKTWLHDAWLQLWCNSFQQSFMV